MFSTPPPHKYFAGLQMYYTCNYNCSYCVQGQRKPPPGKIWEKESVLKIVDFFQNRPEQWKIKLIGGEPTIHPYFAELCGGLTERHEIVVITNNSLSFDKLNKFINSVNNQNVRFACSLQPVDETEDKFDKFVDRIKILKDNGCTVSVSYVATPDRIEKIPVYKSCFKNIGIPFNINVFDGKMNGKTYPNDYTDEEKDFFDLPASRQWFLEKGYPCTYGKLCDYGHTKIIVLGDTGDILGCHFDKKPIGNIYDGCLNLHERSRNCQYKFCSCPRVPYDIATSLYEEIQTCGEQSKDELFKYYYSIAPNTYYDNFNWNPETAEEKQKSFKSLEKAEEAGRMFYKAYKLQGDLYRDMGKLRMAGMAYKKAIALEPENEFNVILKNARFIILPFPVKMLLSLLRKYFQNIYKYYGYAELKTATEMSFKNHISDVLIHDIEEIEFKDGITLYCGNCDPQIYLSLPQPLEKPASIPFCEIIYANSVTGNLQVYWDYGEGLSEENSTRCDIESTSKNVSTLMPIVNWKDGTKLTSLRVDPPDGTTFVLKSIKILEDK